MELYDSLQNGDEKEIIAHLKNVDAIVDDTLLLLIGMIEGDKRWQNKCRFRLKVSRWTRGKPRLEWDTPFGHKIIKNSYKAINKWPTIILKTTKLIEKPPVKIPNSRKHSMHIVASQFGMSERKIAQIVGPKNKPKK